MVRSSVQHASVQVAAAVVYETVEEVMQQLGLQIADETETRGA